MANQPSAAPGGCGYVQSMVDQRPKYDNGVRKPKRKKKKGAK